MRTPLTVYVRRVTTALMCIAASMAIAGERTLVVPNKTLYPRTLIRAEDLTERMFLYDPDGPSAYAEHAESVIGLTARTMLLPNKPIPLASLEQARLILTGARVRIIYEHEGVAISTTGTALQNGAIGDRVRVRNSESGLTVDGIVDQTGDIRIGGE